MEFLMNINLDSAHLMDKIMDSIYAKKYPNASSIVNDFLRSDIRDLYGINLNMFDTHVFSSATAVDGYSSCLTRTYYVYEGPYEKIKEIFGNKMPNEYILGEYPQGMLLGFFATEFRDIEFRKSHMHDYYKFIYCAIYTMTFDNVSSGSSAYSWYKDNAYSIYTFKRMYKDGVDVKSMNDIYFNPIENIDLNSRIELVYAIIKHKEEFISAFDKSYIALYKFFDKYSAIDYKYDYKKEVQMKEEIGYPKDYIKDLKDALGIDNCE